VLDGIGVSCRRVPGEGTPTARALPGGSFEPLQGLGHWPWVDDPSVVDTVIDFLG
jgi:pimeloyl-ACP methyl ester carboxylesterase